MKKVYTMTKVMLVAGLMVAAAGFIPGMGPQVSQSDSTVAAQGHCDGSHAKDQDQDRLKDCTSQGLTSAASSRILAGIMDQDRDREKSQDSLCQNG